MSNSPGLIEHLRTRQPATWALLKLAALDGLVVIDEQTDSVTTTKKLSLADPGLHDTITTLVDSRAERTRGPSAHVARLVRRNSREKKRAGATAPA